MSLKVSKTWALSQYVPKGLAKGASKRRVFLNLLNLVFFSDLLKLFVAYMCLEILNTGKGLFLHMPVSIEYFN